MLETFLKILYSLLCFSLFENKYYIVKKYFYPMSYCLCWHLTVDTSKYLIFSQTVSSWTHLPLLKYKIEVPYWEWVKGNCNLRAINYGLVWTRSRVDYWVAPWSRHMLAFKHPAIAEIPRLGLSDANCTQKSLAGSVLIFCIVLNIQYLLKGLVTCHSIKCLEYFLS